MKIKIRIDKLEPSLDTMVRRELGSRNLPVCLGNMIPPLLRRVLEVEADEFLSSKELTPPDEIKIENPASLIVGDVGFIRGQVVTQKGLDLINNYKNERSVIYADQLIKCVECMQKDICYKLTTTYLKLIKLEEG